MKVLFVTPECAPMVKTGGLGDVSAALPAALAQLGCDVALLMPAYADMKIDGSLEGILALPSNGRWPAAQLLRMAATAGRPPLWLLSCPALYGTADTPYANPGDPDDRDQALRFGFLAHVAALIGSPETPIGWQADIVHANDWPCALAPLYLHQRRQAGQGRTARSVMTIHNLAFQGVFPMAAADLLDVHPAHRGIEGVEFWGQLSMLKAGLQHADAITTVSPTYAAEIQQPELGFGLDGVLRQRAGRLHGLLNGIDTATWNPAIDPLIAAPYSADNLAAKAMNKAALRECCGLRASAGPLLGMVGRLTTQKGVDLVLAGAGRLLARGAQLAVLGRGDTHLEEALTALAAAHPGQVHVTLGFDESLAHLIEAGADCFLMPSRFEPCGLNQMYSQVYGTPPLVTRTGGLADTVQDADARLTTGTGFVMPGLAQRDFDATADRVLTAWQKPEQWAALQRRCMAQDYAWERAAKPYVALYGQLLSETVATAP
ncbi:glycogen synthase GlgA [Acidovorax sp. Leaf78]|uniref:glycogen synthase GlgA n=1 Tax=Acidovorax sp. Leaf78 TaxID=1736237 RepID=UPI0006F3A36B|nr:glycogen synthase [Acidovorax sp. Leaf78]